MKKIQIITVIAIFGAISFGSLEAAKRAMSPAASAKSASAKSASAKAASKTVSKSASKTAIPVSGEKKAVKTEAKRKKSSKQVNPASKKIDYTLTSTQKSKLLVLLNEGTGKELNAINGISKIRSESIIKARPYQVIDDLILVKGIGESTFSSIIAHAKNLPRKSATKSDSSKSKSKKTVG